MIAVAESPRVEPRPRPESTRGPNHPYVDLSTALDRARLMLKAARRYPIGREPLATAWGLSHKSSSLRLTLAALRSFGLIDEVPDRDEPLVKLSELALNIIADYPESDPEQRKCIREAAIRPKIHAELWEKYGDDLPADAEIRRYLIKSRNFNDGTVGSFIREYKSTMEFAGYFGDAKMEPSVASEPHRSESLRFAPGDYVQWTCQGVDRFTEPTRISSLSEDGDFAFFECSKTGVPVHQLAPFNRPASNGSGASEPIAALPAGYRELTYNLVEGSFIIRVPERLGSASYEVLENLLTVVMKESWRSIDDGDGGEPKPPRPMGIAHAPSGK